MTIIYLLLPLALCLAGGFIFAFVWAAKSGQFDDTATPPNRILLDDEDDLSSSKK
ncbi:cbb3-type cytochrome oxidase assembly protein CcoS [bacterium]|nr:cbb3-type cytochrome oxidase assembly protein CcoS [bacterium]